MDQNEKRVDRINSEDILLKIQEYLILFDQVRKEMSNIVVGQKEVIDTIILALACSGHCLVEGVPGIGKTLTIKALSKIMGCKDSRIQFTPDLLPSDIIGINVYDEKQGFYTLKGPIFSNFVLADEINRAPPKVQSALLEGMQENQVTIGKQTYPIDAPFFVMATQNPVENLGTYALPEAQIDRFLFKIKMDYPSISEEAEILEKNMSIFKFDDFKLKSVLSPEKIVLLQKFVKKIYLDKKVEDYIVRVIDYTRNPTKYGVSLGKYIQYGASPRGTIALFISAKAKALLNGRDYVTPHDVKEVAHITLRHRLILNYEGQAEEINPDNVIDEILSNVRIH